jgi:hypothetical protein
MSPSPTSSSHVSFTISVEFSVIHARPVLYCCESRMQSGRSLRQASVVLLRIQNAVRPKLTPGQCCTVANPECGQAEAYARPVLYCCESRMQSGRS